MTKAPFITLEGGEGAGKTTQVRMLVRRISGLGLKVEATRQPGGTPLGAAIRRLVQDANAGSKPIPMAELLLYLADRAQHVEKVIRPALESGTVVVCDRFIDSSEVYQGLGRSLGLAEVRRLNRMVCDETWPDLTLYLDLDPEKGLARAGERQGTLGLDLDRMESEGPEFHRKIRQGFLKQAQAEPERIELIDAALPGDEVAELIWKRVLPLIEKWKSRS